MKTFLLLVTLLLLWKVVRTDWVIETTEFRGDKRNGEVINVIRSYTPPVSPLWDRPKPVEFGQELESWDKAIHLWFGSGASPASTSALKIDVVLILLKTVPFLLLYGFIVAVTAITRRIKKNKPNKSR